MGKVYLARDPVIGRNVALKVISIRPDIPEEEAAQFRERFLREAQAAGALIHPNIVSVHDIGMDPATQSPYIVMEHVPGQDLKKVILSKAPLTGRDAIAIVMQIAAALDYAHKRGIVHRDIKPANVLITDQRRVKITDFGVARLPGSDLTRSDQFVGSPGFMSPEQLQGAQVDGRSDLFALGVILYELLTGKAPFEGSSVSEVLYRITTQPFEPPSEALTEVSPDFDPILEKALSKEPAQRYQTGQEMIEALSGLAEGEVADEPAAATEGAGEEIEDRVQASPWFTLNSQWRLGALVAFLVFAFIGVNWAIVLLFHGPFGETVRLGEGDVRFAGTSLPPMTERAAGYTGSPRQSIDSARDALKAARRGVDNSRPGGIEPNQPIAAICATTTAGPVEIRHAMDASRHQGTPKAVPAASQTVDTPNGRIRVEMKHRMKTGRLVVLVDGRTVLSKPFEATKGKSGTVTHVLSVPAGRHRMEVRLLEDKGAVAARSRITGTVVKNEVARLTGEQSSGKPTLELDWQAPH
jgi:hypothetical protein